MNKTAHIIATVVAITFGLVVLLGYFFDVFSQISFVVLRWAAIVLAFALLLGMVNLIKVHSNRIMTRQSGWPYSIVLILSLGLTLIVGRGGPTSPGGLSVFEYVLRPLESTLFALIAFFMASAAFRAFRIKDFETLLFFIFTIIVLLGQVPVGFQLWPDFPLVKEWVMRVPATAGARGIILGVALGTIATGLRILLGTDRPYIETQ